MSEFLNENDIIEVMTERMSFGLPAVARFTYKEGEKPVVIFVSGAAPQEHVRVRITRKQKNYFDAELVEILKPSPDRITPACPYFGFGKGQCGGCDWQHLSYESQLEQKKEILLHQIVRTTKESHEALEKITQVHKSENQFGYRRRIQVRGNAHHVGFFERGSKNIVHIEKCAVIHPKIQEKWNHFVKTGNLEKLAENKGVFKVEWTLESNGNIVEAINETHAAHGFTQINEEQNEVMRALVEKHVLRADRKKNLLDLYGGKGNLSKDLSRTFQKTICVDSFNKGMRPNKLTAPLRDGLTLVESPVEAFLFQKHPGRLLAGDSIDAVIADPPREGMVGAQNLISDLKAKLLVLVSCDPSTLARDLAKLSNAYSIDGIHLVDMFPQTHHIETVVWLTRK